MLRAQGYPNVELKSCVFVKLVYHSTCSLNAFFHAAYKDLSIGGFTILTDEVMLNAAFSVYVAVDLDIGSVAYGSGAHNYRFRIFLSKIHDLITGDSEEGKCV